MSVEENSHSIKERKNFADNGFVEITIVISSKGNLQNEPLVTFRGLPVYEKEDFKYGLQEELLKKYNKEDQDKVHWSLLDHQLEKDLILQIID